MNQEFEQIENEFQKKKSQDQQLKLGHHLWETYNEILQKKEKKQAEQL